MVLARLFGTLVILCFLLPVLVFLSKFDDAPTVWDDICYLRQAHLFHRFGLGGLDTDLSRDDDGYFSNILKSQQISGAPCHRLMPATGKVVMQYPPGTGFALSLFPDGVRRASVYVSSTVVVAFVLLLSLWRSSGFWQVFSWTLFGCTMIYFTVNPIRSSASLAPTMALCALIGVLTLRMFEHHGVSIAAFNGLLLGLAVDVRIANIFLVPGYVLALLYSLVFRYEARKTAQLSAFAVAFAVGVLPTLIANTINTGSPLQTAYGGPDVVPPQFDLGLMAENAIYYVHKNQGIFVAAAVTLIVLFPSFAGYSFPARCTFVTVIGNLAVNVAYYLTHPVTTPYYAMPFATLTLWAVLSATRLRDDNNFMLLNLQRVFEFLRTGPLHMHRKH
jgi:hypothetical protein